MTIPSGPITKEITKSLLAETVESEALAHLEFIQSQDLLTPGKIKLAIAENIDSWDGVMKGLKDIGYRPEDCNPWRKLGFFPQEAGTPEPGDVARRGEFVGRILSSLERLVKNTEDLARARSIFQSFESATKECLDAIAKGSAPGKKKPKKAVIGELGTEGLRAVARELCGARPQGRWLCATQVSDSLEGEHGYKMRDLLDPLNCILDFTNRKSALDTMEDIRDPSLLNNLEQDGVMLWTPKGDQLGRALKACQNHLSSARSPKMVCFVSPLEVPKGCNEAKHILDLWSCPLVRGKWAENTQIIAFTDGPIEMVPPGDKFPVVQWKALAIFIVAFKPAPAIPHMITLGDPLLEVGTGKGFFVDLPAASILDIKRELWAGLQQRKWRICSQAKSPASSPDFPRILLQIAINDADLSRLEAELIMEALKRRSEVAECLWAPDSISTNGLS